MCIQQQQLTDKMSKQVQNYVLQDVLGEGSYGCVYSAQHTISGQKVAIKQMSMNKFQKLPKLYEFICNEIDVLSQVKNKNIIKFNEVFRTPNNVYLVYELCNGGTLESQIKSQKFLNESDALKILGQLIDAFKSLGEKKILHRDLKPGNILFHDQVLKVADFGFCKSLKPNQDLTKTVLGSPIYMAPEVLKGLNYSTKADIWSMGVVFFETLFGHCPYEDKSVYGLIKQIDTNPLFIPTHKNKISLQTDQMLKSMLVVSDQQRIDIKSLSNLYNNHPLIKSYSYQSPQKPLQNITNTQSPMSSGHKVYRRNTEKLQNRKKIITNFEQTYYQKDQEFLQKIYKERNKIMYISQILQKIIQNQNYKSIISNLCGIMALTSKSLQEKVNFLIQIDKLSQMEVNYNTIELIGLSKNEHEAIFQKFQAYMSIPQENFKQSIKQLIIQNQDQQQSQIQSDLLNLLNLDSFFDQSKKLKLDINLNKKWNEQNYFIFRKMMKFQDLQNQNIIRAQNIR